MRRRVVYETPSPLSGHLAVVDVGPERHLLQDGDVLSTYPRDGDWARVRQEYWGEALDMAALPPHPSVLFVGLGGGTQVHLLRARVAPRRITVIEHDRAIVRIATRWFGLDGIPNLELLCADAAVAVRALCRARRRFDFVMEDCTSDETSPGSIELARSLVRLVSRRGVLILNRHFRPQARATERALAPMFAETRLRRVRREADNILVYCTGPVGRATRARAVLGVSPPRPLLRLRRRVSLTPRGGPRR